MKKLFTPWRMKYIKEERRKTEGCLFCNIISSERDGDNLVVYRSERTVVVMNKYPYIAGHTMVLPIRHVAGLDDLDQSELFEVFYTTTLTTRAIDEVMSPHGFNIGINLGKVAGAGMPAHLHVHVVPRWEGDHNFMAVTGDTMVIPESVKDTAHKLARAFDEIKREK